MEATIEKSRLLGIVALPTKFAVDLHEPGNDYGRYVSRASHRELIEGATKAPRV